MRITCPHCGERDLREFTYRGDAVALARPDPDAGAEVWDGYVHQRDNPAGETREMWYHDPCGTWIVATRNTVSHRFGTTVPAAEAAR